ncbi:MAG: GDCCVxC domain-containing (seleno)protein [Candidatus Hodarchaeales archaeon]
MFILNSTVTCPTCGHKNTVSMPEDSCQLLYICPECNLEFRPKQGDCCVFCSYGDVKCPPMQE